jgi:hypothetical protein
MQKRLNEGREKGNRSCLIAMSNGPLAPNLDGLHVLSCHLLSSHLSQSDLL